MKLNVVLYRACHGWDIKLETVAFVAALMDSPHRVKIETIGQIDASVSLAGSVVGSINHYKQLTWTDFRVENKIIPVVNDWRKENG